MLPDTGIRVQPQRSQEDEIPSGMQLHRNIRSRTDAADPLSLHDGALFPEFETTAQMHHEVFPVPHRRYQHFLQRC